jgi:hypothetical protein
MATTRTPIDRAQKLLAILGWSFGDVSDSRSMWSVYAHRDDQRILVRASGQSQAWDEALRQAGIVQRVVA